jgi:DNA-binding transcriptional LysR family regulator
VLSTEQAISDARHRKDEASGQVIFAMPPSINLLVGIPLVEALAKRSPQVKVRIVEAFTGRGIGREIAPRLARDGASLLVHYGGSEAGEDVQMRSVPRFDIRLAYEATCFYNPYR